MRIHGGAAGGRSVRFRKDRAVRPTTSKVREALFSILGPALEGSSFLDLFAGSGLVGIEALSRGAGRVTFVDLSARALHLVKEAVTRLGLAGEACCVRSEGRRFLRRAAEPFDLIFVDPPYAAGLVPEVLAIVGEKSLLAPAGLVVVEHHHKTELPDSTEGLSLHRREKYGETRLSFYRSVPGGSQEDDVSGRF